MAGTLFSDSWFRVSDLRVALLPSVEVTEQTFRGRTWHILQDTYTQRYFRASPQACRFIQSLNTGKTVNEVWEDFVSLHPEDAPSREEVIQLLSQLHLSNLLYSLQQSDNAAIVKRYQTFKNRELMGKLASFLYLRIPLWDPDAFLNRIHPLSRMLTGWGASVVWSIVVLLGALTAFEHRAELLDQSQGILSISNLPWLYVCLSILKLFHEAGHAFVCKRFGGEVRTFGVMFLLFTPLPYVDASSSWGFASRWQRIYVGFAGMAVEFFFAAAGALIWAHTAPGLVHSLAFNIMLIGSISSLLFNGNPLLRFDAYYILSDFAEIPNLYQKAQQQWQYFGDRYLLGTVSATSKASDQREWYWLTLYGLLSFLYLLLVTAGIVLFLMDQWLPLGLFVLLVFVYGKFAVPLYRLIRHVLGQATQGNRKRAIAATAGIALMLVMLIAVIPFPHNIRTQGILKASGSSLLYLETSGKLDQLHVRHGDRVSKGQRIATLTNPDLITELRITESARAEALMQLRRALHKASNELDAIQQKLDSLQAHAQDLQQQLKNLEIIAHHDGEWVATDLHELKGSWLHRGYALGEIVDRRNFQFVSVVTQEQADILFKNEFKRSELRLAGQSDLNVVLNRVFIIPYQSQQLPSSALGWLGGGDIAVNTSEPSGEKTQESFFLLQTSVPSQQVPDLTVLHGLSGTLRLELPMETLYGQAYRALKQLVQKRYAL